MFKKDSLGSALLKGGAFGGIAKLMSKDVEKQHKNLLGAGLITEDEVLIDYKQCSCYKKVLGIGKWEQGWIYFLETKIIYILGFGVLNEPIIINYKNVKEMERTKAMMLPFGLKITYTDEKSGETRVDEFSIQKRDEWIKFIEERMEA